MTYELYYDRSSKCWWGYWMDEEGNQTKDAVNAYTKEQCLIELGAQRGRE